MISPDQFLELAGMLSKQFRQSIPVDVDLWTAQQVGAYLKCSDRYVLEYYCTLPDFPEKIRLPSKSGRGHPLWNASEVIAWAQKYRRRKEGRIRGENP